MLVDVTPLGVTGKEAEHLLDEIGITVNKNGIPFDPLPPNTASGIRLGTPATTSRGFGEDEMRAVGRIIIEAINGRDDQAAQRRLAGEVADIVARFPVPGLPPRDDARVVTFIEEVGTSVGPIVAVFVAGGAPRARPDPDRPADRAALPHRRPARMRAASTRARSRAPAASRSPRPSWSSPAGSCSSTPAADWVPTPLTLGPATSSRCSSAVRPRRHSVASTTCSTCAPAGSWPARSGSGCSRSRSASGSPSSTTRSATTCIRFSEPFSVGFTVFWIVGMINSINWIDGLDGLSTGIALIAVGDAGAPEPDDAGQPAARRGPVLRAGRGAGRVPALELPPGEDLQRDERRPVRRLHAGRARRSSARPRSRSRCSSSACRSSTRSGSSCGGVSRGGSPFAPDRSHIHHRLLDLGLSHRDTVLADLRDLRRARRARDAPDRASPSCTRSSACSSCRG